MQSVVWEVLAKDRLLRERRNILARIKIARDTYSGGHLRKAEHRSIVSLYLSITRNFLGNIRLHVQEVIEQGDSSSARRATRFYRYSTE
jgi:hypothetical protein